MVAVMDEGPPVCEPAMRRARPDRPGSGAVRHIFACYHAFMITPAQTARPFDWRLPPGMLRAGMFCFLYWLCFLLVLEPGNLLGASEAGALPSFPHEAIRIVVAALLGTGATALPARLTWRLPVMGAAWSRRALIHAAGAGALAFVLILVSCLLAAWILEGAWLPTPDEVRAELVGNWLLLTYALGALTAILHVVELLKGRSAPAADAPAPAPAPTPTPAHAPAAIPVKTRGTTHLVDLADVDWIETQGNYLALHTGAGSHLVRDTLSAFERRLDPTRFVRIHRRAIVAVDRIAAMKAAGNGDALLWLQCGQELRVSRSYRDALKTAWPPSTPSPQPR